MNTELIQNPKTGVYYCSSSTHREINDCVVRAITHMTEIPYEDAYEFCKRKMNRVARKGVPLHTLIDTLLTKDVCGNRFKMIGDTYVGSFNSNSKKVDVYTPGTKRRYSRGVKSTPMTVGAFMKKNPIGKYMVIISGHTFVIKDGVIYGNYDDTQQLRKKLVTVFKIED